MTKHRKQPKASVDRHTKELEGSAWMSYEEAMMWEEIKDNLWRKLPNDNTTKKEDKQIQQMGIQEDRSDDSGQTGNRGPEMES